MVPKKVITSLLLLYITVMLAKESEGYLAFYSREDLRRMQEKEKNQAQKKSLDTRDFVEFAEDEGQVIKVHYSLDYDDEAGDCSSGNWNTSEFQAAGKIPRCLEGAPDRGVVRY